MKTSKLLVLGMLVAALAVPAMATQSPPGCLNNHYVLDLGKSVTFAYDETHPLGPSIVTFSVDTGNPNPSGLGCDCSSVDTVLTTPDGTPHTCEIDQDYPAGTAVAFLCSEPYTVDSSDVVGGVVTASANSLGILDDNPIGDDPLDITKTISIVIIYPSTVVTIGADPINGSCTGYETTLTISETNTGDVPLTDVYVNVGKDTGGGEVFLTTLDEDTPGWSSDVNGDDVLDPGETWSWAVVDTVTVNPTIYTARGFGTDPLDNVISYPSSPGEKDLVTVGCTEPPEIEVTKSVSCDVSKVGDEVIYTICIQNIGPVPVVPTLIFDTVLGDLLPDFIAECPAAAILLPQEECCVDFPYTIQPGDPNPLVNEVTFIAEDEIAQVAGPVYDDAIVDLVDPNLELRKGCAPDHPDANLVTGGVAIFNIEVENTGTVCLDVTLTDPCAVGFSCGPFTLQPGDIENCTVEVDIPEDMTGYQVWNDVSAYWTICYPPATEDPICLDNEGIVDANDYCDISGGMTRTPGFWKTHTALADHVLTVHVPGCGDPNDDGCIDLGFIRVCDIQQFCAVMWANKSNNTDGSKRTKLDQARMHAAFHALAAILNQCVPSGGGMPVTVEYIRDTLGGTNIPAIKALMGLLGAYNESGDANPLLDPDAPMGSATPSECRGYDQSFADTEKVAKKGKGPK